ncbi:MAG: MBL fold metallo-hydrolase [Tepidisphaera sp.]|nr:MBL fold metallo-hydrolase [Tepidisphaera sp.]
MFTRREALRLAVVSAAGAALVPSVMAQQDDTFFTWKPAAGAKVAFGYGGNALVLAGKDAALLVDCKNAPFGDCLRREAGPALKHVVNTHHHADHTGGNHAFTKDIKLIAQINATPRILGQMNRYVSQLKEAITQLADAKGPAADQVRAEARAVYARVEHLKATDFVPAITFDTDEKLDVGGIEVNLHHYGPGHTDNDLVVHVPSKNLLHTGDLLFHQRHPYIDLDGGASTEGWVKNLAKLIALCDAKTVVVPGHGEITNVEGLKGQVRYFEVAKAAIEKAYKAGKSRKEVAEMSIPELGTLEGDGIRPIAFGAMYDELKHANAK